MAKAAGKMISVTQVRSAIKKGVKMERTIKALGLRRIRILTNNPRKLTGLLGYGLEIVERVAIEIPANDANRRYLSTKHMGGDADRDLV